MQLGVNLSAGLSFCCWDTNIYIFQFKLFSQSLATRAWMWGSASSEPVKWEFGSSSTSNRLLIWKHEARLIFFGGIWIRDSSMLIMYCGNWSEAPYQQRIGAKRFHQSGKIYIETFLIIMILSNLLRPWWQFSFLAATSFIYFSTSPPHTH